MSDKIRQEYQEKLGVEFGAVFDGLRNEWAAGKMRSDEFRELFSNAEDVGLLNAISGGGFIWDVQHIFWNDLMLRLCRMTDPIQTGSKNNLTVRKLSEFCEEQALRSVVRSRIDTAVEAAEFARPWRNQRISHTDLAGAITPNAEPLCNNDGDHQPLEWRPVPKLGPFEWLEKIVICKKGRTRIGGQKKTPPMPTPH